jgi:uncharacterized membrane protein (DUF485 family)
MSKVKFAMVLLVIYTVLYFGVALMTSASFKDVAGTVVAGLPLAIWGGLSIIVAGVIITRLYLIKMSESDEAGGAH